MRPILSLSVKGKVTTVRNDGVVTYRERLGLGIIQITLHSDEYSLTDLVADDKIKKYAPRIEREIRCNNYTYGFAYGDPDDLQQRVLGVVGDFPRARLVIFF